MKAIILLLLLPNLCFAQMISNDPDCLDEAPIVFNPEFIKQRRIKSIKGRVSIKRTGQTMRTTNQYTQYFFDEEGRVTRSFEPNDLGKEIWRKYFYNDRGYMIYQSFGDAWDIHYSTYLFDDSVRVVAKDDFVRKEDNMGIPYTKETKSETYSFDYTDSSEIKTLKNHAGTPYMKHERFRNYNGQVVRQEDRYIATKQGSIIYFEYDHSGNITLKNQVSSKQKRDILKYEYAYDKLGNLKEKKHYEKGVLKFETQYIVNQDTGKLSAVLEQEAGSNNLRIIRFQTYEYYD